MIIFAEPVAVPVPPDGGWGWVVVAASFFANLVVDGISYSFGIFIEDFAEYFKEKKAVIALAGSLQTGIYLTVGPIVSGLVNRFGARKVMIAGSLIGTVALLLSIFAPSISFFLIAYGVIGGNFINFIKFLLSCFFLSKILDQKFFKLSIS